MGGQAQEGNSRIGDGPGGGIGPPIDAPDPLQKYRWWIIGGFIIALFGGAYYVNTRQRVAVAGGSNGTGPEVEMQEAAMRPYKASPLVPASPVTRPSPPAVSVAPARPSMLLEALKEELFQLEVEHKQGKISQQEYEKAKAALDGTLERAIKREAQKV